MYVLGLAPDKESMSPLIGQPAFEEVELDMVALEWPLHLEMGMPLR